MFRRSVVVLSTLAYSNVLFAAGSIDPSLFASFSKWAKGTETAIATFGTPLSREQVTLAREAGVRDPEKIRILVSDQFPSPPDSDLNVAASRLGLISAENAALTIGHSILIRTSHASDQTLYRHELTHVAQYEKLGGVDPFLAVYVAQVAEHGYDRAPLELEAISAEHPIY
jgi:hypothetical protein